MANEKRNLQTVLGELESLQNEYKGKNMPEDVGAQFATLAKEAKEMQDALDREDVVRRAREGADREAKNREILNPAVPAEGKDAPARTVGYMSLGDFFASQESLRDFAASNFAKGQEPRIEVGIRRGRNGRPTQMVALTKEMASEIQQKAPPTIADRVIPYDRDNDLVLGEEYVPPRLLDVLNIVQTNAPTVEWVRRNTRTRGAATQSQVISEGKQGLKGEHAQGYELVSTPIRTHAVFQPVTEQQLSDWPALQSLIDMDLNDDMNQYLEEQILYGDGIGTNFSGFFEGSNVPVAGDGRAAVDDTLIDTIRRGITDIRRAQFNPNAAIVDPIDWESIVLAKGEDEHYIWAVVTEQGVSRLWGLPVIETVKVEDAATGERNILIGDFSRGATLYDRMTRTVTVGLIDDQFVRNMRTILMEARAGFAIRRPLAFAKVQTDAGS